MRATRATVLALAVLALLAGLAVHLARPAAAPAVRARLSVPQALAGGEVEGFQRAVEPRPFSFPADHGPHPGFRTEWWYYTGHLATGDGRLFGYQLTFFRNALTPRPATRRSAWAASDIYMAHFALTDVDGGTFRAFERFSRGALGLAGASARPFRVWLEDWSAAGGGATDSEVPPMRLSAAQEGVGVELELAPGKPVVLQGERGLSRKGQEPGNASYYYSLTRLPCRGTVRLDGRAFAVTGTSWMDREWSTSALEPGLAGWDWFALQLDDGRDLMFYRLRRDDGGAAPSSAGTLVDGAGNRRPLTLDDVELRPEGSWTSPRSGAVYPARWHLRLPHEDLDLEITPRLADQEHSAALVYWEGAVAVDGKSAGLPVAGSGYVELTGYD